MADKTERENFPTFPNAIYDQINDHLLEQDS